MSVKNTVVNIGSFHIDPVLCDISLILSFLQELLEKVRSPSTLKVYVAAMAASHTHIDVHT